LGYVEAVVALAAISWIIAPGRNSAQIIEEMNQSLSQTIRVATGGTIIENIRTAAEKFHEDAMRAIGDFWKGFTEDE